MAAKHKVLMSDVEVTKAAAKLDVVEPHRFHDVDGPSVECLPGHDKCEEDYDADDDDDWTLHEERRTVARLRHALDLQLHYEKKTIHANVRSAKICAVRGSETV